MHRISDKNLWKFYATGFCEPPDFVNADYKSVFIWIVNDEISLVTFTGVAFVNRTTLPGNFNNTGNFAA
jgi:hypothetical protein